MPYRGRLAPSPTGYLHVGHAITFWQAQERARAAGGELVLRIEDLDPDRCRPEFREAIVEDLHWFGLRWDAGPDVGGPHAPYVQSERTALYRSAWEQLRAARLHLSMSPARAAMCSRRQARRTAKWTSRFIPELAGPQPGDVAQRASQPAQTGGSAFRMARRCNSSTAGLGEQTAVAGRDFGDFVIWRKDDVPAYQLAVVVDDAAMRITEVVRGADLLVSTFRQLLIYRALGLTRRRSTTPRC